MKISIYTSGNRFVASTDRKSNLTWKDLRAREQNAELNRNNFLSSRKAVNNKIKTVQICQLLLILFSSCGL